MSQEPKNSPVKLAILQRVCAPYRLPLFRQLAGQPDLNLLLLYGEDIPDSKVRSASQIEGVTNRKLKTRFLRIGRRILPWHAGLMRALKEFEPDVILCEGESHFLGYVTAIAYRALHKRRTGLVHWCFISLPGKPLIERGFAALIKSHFRRYFDAFLLYSTFSKERLCALGIPEEKAFVATNVGDVAKFIKLSNELDVNKVQARQRLGLPDRFTVLYVGTMDDNKRPQLLLDLARKAQGRSDYNFVLLGVGPLLPELKRRIEAERLENVYLPGRVTDQLPLYYRGSNVLVIPGRGGIVISEAMAFGLPVITYQADGTEFDLIRDGITGLRLSDDKVADFWAAIESLGENAPACEAMSIRARQLLESQYTTENMVAQIGRAVRFARDARRSSTTGV